MKSVVNGNTSWAISPSFAKWKAKNKEALVETVRIS